MTKRKPKNVKPTGFNQSLGNSLVNRENLRPKIINRPNVAEPEEPKKVLDSVTHETSLEEFLNNADLANRDFAAERADFRIIAANEASVVNADDLKTRPYDELVKEYGHFLKIPRRPTPDQYGNAEELNAMENEMFLLWRRDLAQLTEGYGVVLTPFERNLELWRQLWRVVERSDLVVTIVDARNPVLFRNADLENYVKEVDDQRKGTLLLVNKADLLTPGQLDAWREYFKREHVPAVFWSALEGTANENVSDDAAEGVEHMKIADLSVDTCPYLRNTEDLIYLLKKCAFEHMAPGASSIVVGMVGYPNVGKSSTINCLMGAKKTSVSATPGKTKHFQTLIVDEQMTLCDCPGLVMPSFGFSSSEMVLNGILAVDQMRDFFSPTQVLCNRIPREHFEAQYSIMLPKPADHEDSDRPPTAHELLTTVAFLKGFMSTKGVPDCSRAARMMLKDVVSGKLKWSAAPPGGPSQVEFDEMTFSTMKHVPEGSKPANSTLLEQARLNKRNLLEGARSSGSKVDNTFFGGAEVGAHVKGVKGMNAAAKPDKKHNNKGKREKLRRIHVDLDA